MNAGAALDSEIPNLHLQHLRYLRETVRAGGVMRAAETLHVSQPALSQSLAEMERRLGVRLFERAGRGRRLTAAGEQVLAFAERVMVDAEGLQRSLAAYGRGDGGVLRVGMIDAASMYVLPSVIRSYRAEHPGVDLRIAVETSEELLRRLRAYGLDLAFVVDAAGEPDLVTEEVAREPMYWYAPAGEAGSAEDAGWALYPEGSRTRRLIDEGFARAGIRSRVTLESHNPEVLRQVARMGLGWTVLPPAVVNDDAASGLVRGTLLAERPMHATWRRTAPRDARVEAFMAAVRVQVRKPAASGGGAKT